MQQSFELEQSLPPYVFEAIYQLKEEAKKNGKEIIDFGMGNPDMGPPDHVIQALHDAIDDKKSYGYSVVGGIAELKKSVADYYKRRFGVDLNYENEVIATLGAKEGITSLATAISSHDNYFVVQNPSYPIHTFAFIIARAQIKHINAIKPRDFFEKFKNLVENSSKKPIAVIVNYPCNPTSEIVDLAFYEELVAFCKKHKIYVISDIAYAEIYYDEKNKPHSILEVEGAKDVAIEFSSVSKSYSLAGMRMGFAVGNKNLISKLYKIKSYLDYGSFKPNQIACAAAKSQKSDAYLEKLRKIYFERAKTLVALLRGELGWEVEMPQASMFLWAKLPPKFAHYSSFEFCKKLILDYGIAFSPGSGFGENGEGFVRLSLIHDEENMKKMVERLKNFFVD